MTDGKPSLKPLFEPQHVAVIGASTQAGKQGNSAVRYLLQAGFGGRISPINPGGGEIEGLACLASIKDAPGRVDCALMVIPAGATAAAMRDCAAAGVRSVIIGASGFAEMGSAAGVARQREVLDIAQAAGIRLLGPNTNGIWNAAARFSLGYNTSHGDPMGEGNVSIAAHSGALMNSFVPRLAKFGAGLQKFVPLGNEADIDLLEVVEYFIDDAATGVIGLIIEGLPGAERLRAAAARAHRAGKPIVALKLGRSSAGAGAALAHSSRLAGSARAYAALFRECGIATVRSIETLAGLCTLAGDGRALARDGDRSIIALSSSGGGCSLIADHAADLGLRLAGADDGSWTGETARQIATYEGIGQLRNPIDGGNLHGWDKLEDIFQAMERDRLLGPVVAWAHKLPRVPIDEALQGVLTRRKERTGAPTVVLSPGGLRPHIEERYGAARMPVFHDVPTCFESLRGLYDLQAYAAEREAAAGDAPLAEPAGDWGSVRKRIRASRDSVLSELESGQLLSAAGVPIVASGVVNSLEEALEAARRLSGPVVLKALVPGVAHKNDAGLVAVGLQDGEAVRGAYERLVEVAGVDPAQVCMIMQPMIASKLELIVGTTYEAPLGHFLLVGLGGVHAEIIDSVLLLPVPMTREALLRRLAADKVGKLVDKVAGSAGCAAVVDVLWALQGLVTACGDVVQSVDVNPLLVTTSGVVGVDALVVARAA